MAGKCSDSNCYVHEGQGCMMGHIDLADCECYNSEAATETEEASPKPVDGAKVPWTGSALGLTDLVTLLPRGRSILVGVLGAHDAGKTTLLLGTYLKCLHGSKIAEAEFAGSRTLAAWESLAAWARLEDATNKPHFPPHTPRGADRAPGILHLALRRSDQSHRDVLLTDAPGEWFTSWAINEEANDAEGARWTVEHADVFLVFADCVRLTGKDRGNARNDLRQLIERLGKHIGNRPVILVWTKTDEAPLESVPEGFQKAIRRAVEENLLLVKEASTSVKEPETLTEALSLALNEVWQPAYAQPLTAPVLDHHPFSAFRGLAC